MWFEDCYCFFRRKDGTGRLKWGCKQGCDPYWGESSSARRSEEFAKVRFGTLSVLRAGGRGDARPAWWAETCLREHVYRTGTRVHAVI